MTTIGEIITLQRGFDITKLEQTHGEFPVISSSGIKSYHDSFKVEGPGVIIGRKGTLGTVFFVNESYWPHDTSLWVKDFKGNYPKFIYYFLQAFSLEKLDVGSANPTLNRNHVHLVEAEIPDLTDQKRIAKVLSGLDSKIDLNNRINAELEAMAKLVYDYWFVQFDFPISAATAASMGKAELVGKPYKRSGGPMVYNEVLKREVPKSWEVGSLNDLGTIVGGSTPSKSKPENFSQSGTPWITPKDLSNNKGNIFISRGEFDVSEPGLKEASLKIMPKGTILLSTRAPIGYLAISRFDVTTNQGFKSFIPDKTFSTPFIYHTIQSHIKVIEQNASGSTFKEISSGVLKSIVLGLPDEIIHERFIQVVNPIFDKQDLLEQQNQELTSLRDWLLPMLMNGQVKVKEAEEALSKVIEER